MKIAVIVDPAHVEAMRKLVHRDVVVIGKGERVSGQRFDVAVDLSRDRRPDIEREWSLALTTTLTPGGMLVRPEDDHG